MDAEALCKLGSLEQIACLRPLHYEDGRRQGLRAIEVKNGALRFMVLAGKCLDIGELSWRGENFSFLAPCGLQGREAFDYDGVQAQRSVMCGMLFTCGPDNVGPPQKSGEPLHGRFRSTPAVHVGTDMFWQDGQCVMEVRGEMRQGVLFGENLVLRRRIRTVLGESFIEICDVLTNEGFRPEQCMMLYHCNAGYPLLDAGTEISIPSKSVLPRDAAAQTGIDRWNVMDPPVPEAPEQVFYHKVSGAVTAAVYNQQTGRKLSLGFCTEELPCLTEWKSTAAGNYALGLEAGTCFVEGREKEQQTGRLFRLAPGESRNFHLTIRVE